MATIKAFSDLKQSKELEEILPLESADMHYHYDNDFGELESIPTITEEDDHFALFSKDVRCWSLAVLLGVLPEIQGGKPVISLDDNYITYPHMSDLHTKADNLVDACYKVIIKLYELKML